MIKLSADQYAGVLAVVRDVSAARTRDEFGAAVVAAVPALIASEVTSLNEVDPDAHRLNFWSEPADLRYPDEAMQAWFELAAQHPLIQHYTETGDGSARRISDLLPARSWLASALYQRFYRVVGVRFQMSITLPAPLPIVIGLAVNRSTDDFDETDRAVLNLLRPHLAHTWRQVREHEGLRALLDSTTRVLDASEAGAIALTDPIQELTTGALVNLYRFFGRPAVLDPLPPRVRTWLDRQRSADRRDELRLPEPLHAVRDGRRLVLRFLPAGSEGPDVLLLDEHGRSAAAGTLRAAGLTHRETQVLETLITGASTQQIASVLSVSPWTVKRHLANIYTKLGVTGRVGATAMALEITAHHADP